jgi:8-oxo-dGTP pyrophosphatase MutT (NUDIX family)
MSNLQQELDAYIPTDAQNAQVLDEMHALLRNAPDCFERTADAHFTASAWILSAQIESVVLLFHRKFSRWIQPGGHPEGNPDLCAVALQEARQETSLWSLRLASERIFDIDAFDLITPSGALVRHYDVRWRFIADEREQPIHNHEAKSAAWISLARLDLSMTDASVMRMLHKSTEKHDIV